MQRHFDEKQFTLSYDLKLSALWKHQNNGKIHTGMLADVFKLSTLYPSTLYPWYINIEQKFKICFITIVRIMTIN